LRPAHSLGTLFPRRKRPILHKKPDPCGSG
jgi:hypothetical protein